MPDPAKTEHSRFEHEVMPLVKDLHRAAYAYTRNAADAEDLVQETLLRAFRAFDSLTGEYRLKAWLLSIMRNTWISRYRATLRRPPETLTGDLHDGHVDAKGFGPDSHSAEHIVLRDMPDPHVVDALEALPEPLRLTVYYVAVVGLSCHEVSTVMGVPKGTVMSRMYRSRLHLRRHLGAHPHLAAHG